MLRLLADENVPAPLVAALRDLGMDVAWVVEDAPGEGDPSVLSRGQTERRVILTSDRGFGELAFRQRLPAESGIILIRIQTDSLDQFVSTCLTALRARDDWHGQFSVLEIDRVRMTPLP